MLIQWCCLLKPRNRHQKTKRWRLGRVDRESPLKLALLDLKWGLKVFGRRPPKTNRAPNPTTTRLSWNTAEAGSVRQLRKLFVQRSLMSKLAIKVIARCPSACGFCTFTLARACCALPVLQKRVSHGHFLVFMPSWLVGVPYFQNPELLPPVWKAIPFNKGRIAIPDWNIPQFCHLSLSFCFCFLPSRPLTRHWNPLGLQLWHTPGGKSLHPWLARRRSLERERMGEPARIPNVPVTHTDRPKGRQQQRRSGF